MIDLQQKTEWQFVDEETQTGLLFPWLTKSCLDEIVTWNLKDKVIFEYGLGASTVWWSIKCHKVYGVESNKEYYLKVAEYVFPRVNMSLETESNAYINCPMQWGRIFDIIVIDGIYREECVPVALECLNKDGCIIYDNWMQPSVEVQSEETQKLLLSYPHNIYHQEGHADWKTLVVYNK